MGALRGTDQLLARVLRRLPSADTRTRDLKIRRNLRNETRKITFNIIFHKYVLVELFVAVIFVGVHYNQSFVCLKVNNDNESFY